MKVFILKILKKEKFRNCSFKSLKKHARACSIHISIDSGYNLFFVLIFFLWK